MAQPGTITMTMREVDRLRIIQSLADGLLMPWQAAERLHLSRRQVERLTLRYRSQGASGLLPRRRRVVADQLAALQFRPELRRNFSPEGLKIAFV